MGAGGFEGRTSSLKRTLFLRKVKLKMVVSYLSVVSKESFLNPNR